MSDVPHDSESVELKPGWSLLAYTDGLTETTGPRGDLWGTGEVLALLRSGEADTPARVVLRLLDRAAAFRASDPPQDDVTVMVARYSAGCMDGEPATDSAVTASSQVGFRVVVGGDR